MASNYRNRTGNSAAWRSIIPYILITERVLGDVADLAESSNFGGKVNKIIQSVIDNLNWLAEKVKDASTTRKGIIEVATAAEADAGTDTTRAMTPALVKRVADASGAPDASTTRKGIIEVATQAEALNGADTSRAMTPRTSIDQLRGSNAQATEGRRGTAERASRTEAEAGTDDNRMMTPLKTENHFDNKVQKKTQAQFNALTTQQKSGKIFFIVG